jgi:hypothetical protein
MVPNPNDLILDFSKAIAPRQVKIEHELISAPQRTCRLPFNKCAVYAFSFTTQYGAEVQAGANRALKVGRVGANSNARFQSQHYGINSAPSTLAKRLLHTVVLWPYLGIDALREGDIRD